MGVVKKGNLKMQGNGFAVLFIRNARPLVFGCFLWLYFSENAAFERGFFLNLGVVNGYRKKWRGFFLKCCAKKIVVGRFLVGLNELFT